MGIVTRFCKNVTGKYFYGDQTDLEISFFIIGFIENVYLPIETAITSGAAFFIA